MSLATRQTILILTMVSGSMRMIQNSGNTDCEREITAAETECTWLANYLYKQVDMAKVKRWISAKKKEWAATGEALAMDEWHPSVLSTMALNYCEDLLQVEGNEFVRKCITGIRNKLTSVSYHFAEANDYNEKHFEEASHMTEEVYSVIGFSR